MPLVKDLNEVPRISPNQLGIWTDCPQAWEYGYVERLTKKGATKAHFDVGVYAHETLHAYFHMLKAGYRIGDALLVASVRNRMETDLERLFQEEGVPPSERLAVFNKVSRIINGYLLHQTPIIDSGIQVEEVEEFFEVPFTTSAGIEVILNGYIDLRYKKAGKRRLRDHKTGERCFYSLENIRSNEQLLFYLAAMEIMGFPVDIIEISYLSTFSYKDKPTPDQLFKFFPVEMSVQSRAMTVAWLDTKLNAMYTSESTHRNLSTGCPRCAYWDICKTELRGISSVNIKKGLYERKPDAPPKEHTNVSTETPCRSDDEVPGRFSINLNL